jgi:hypothetical protein
MEKNPSDRIDLSKEIGPGKSIIMYSSGHTIIEVVHQQLFQGPVPNNISPDSFPVLVTFVKKASRISTSSPLMIHLL